MIGADSGAGSARGLLVEGVGVDGPALLVALIRAHAAALSSAA